MSDEELLEEVAEEIRDTGEALIGYEGYADKRGAEYGDGWNDAIDQFVLELLGTKGEDSVEKLEEEIKGTIEKPEEVKSQ
ncbi:hypothetical protein KY092_07935 [Natronomonas gomsonensis]|uniref:hypothetical protein n=1 Tax=Natronomonas gomsonensis TaxID=1046043 RepID=UPI0020CA852E|nr:hypothetical protein [Natronomonas gomsonensis]MCY4730486.1 hypothetical protein [Natronomonas gomsonensis]